MLRAPMHRRLARWIAAPSLLLAACTTSTEPAKSDTGKAESKAKAETKAKADAKQDAKRSDGKAVELEAPTTAVTPARPSGEPRSWSFDGEGKDAVAKGLRISQSGEQVDPPATWAVVEVEDAPSPPHAFGVTKTVGTNKTFNLALIEDTRYADVDITVMLKPLTGSNNQGGGVVFRAKGDNDYYVARWNPVETNFRLYALIGGARVDLKSAPLDLDVKQWHSLRVVAEGEHIECFVDDKPVVQADDKSLPDAGMVGLWTKGDAATLFDELTVTAPSH